MEDTVETYYVYIWQWPIIGEKVVKSELGAKRQYLAPKVKRIYRAFPTENLDIYDEMWQVLCQRHLVFKENECQIK